MLCSFEPVKYCRAAPNDSAGTARRSTCTPAGRRSDIFVSPRAMIEATAAVVGQVVHHGVDVAGDDQEIQVADGFLAAAIAAGGGDLLDGLAAVACGPRISWTCWSASIQRIRCSASAAMSSPCRMAASILAPKPLSSLDLVRLAGRAEFVERGDVQFVIELAARFGPRPGHAEDRQHAFGNLGQQFFEHRQRAGLRPAWRPSRPGPCRCPRCRSASGSGSATMSAADSGRSWIVRAALR